jgi:hypothetical protein
VFAAPEDLVIYELSSTRLRDHEDAASVVRQQGDKLDDRSVLHWPRQFQQALNDSTLVAEYTRLRAGRWDVLDNGPDQRHILYRTSVQEGTP